MRPGRRPRPAAALRLTALGVLLCGAVLASGCGDAAPDRLDVLIVTFDTTRADRFGAYGRAEAETPVFDALAREGRLFERAWSPVPITLPAHTTLLTGTAPPVHGVRENAVYRVQDESLLLSEVLSEHGWRTGAFVGSFVLDERFGLDQGFDVYHAPAGESLGTGEAARRERPAGEVVDDALSWFNALPSAAPFFAWVHFNDPHAGYDPPEPHASRHAHPYDGEIAYADEQLGRLLDGLDRLGRRESLLLIVTADHGEALGEHGEETHGLFLYDASLRIPLVLVTPDDRAALPDDRAAPPIPDRPGRIERIAAPVTLADIAPTVLDALGLGADVMPAASEPSLLPLTDDPASWGSRTERALYIETLMPWHHHRWHPLRGLVWRDRKLIDSSRPELYDLAADPNELRDGAPDEPELLALMRERLDALLVAERPLEHALGAALSPEERQRLAALGYVGTASADDPFDPSLPTPRERIGDLALASSVTQRIAEATSLLGLDGDPAAAARVAAAYPDPAERTAQGRRLLDAARDDLRALRQRNPGDPLFAFDLGFVEFHRGDAAAAIEPFETHALAVPDEAVTRYYLAECYERTGRADWARAEMLQAVTLQPRSGRLMQWLADHHGRRGEWGHAVWWLEQQVRTSSTTGAERAALQAQVRLARQQMAAARQSLQPPDDYPATDRIPAGVRAGP